MLTLENSAQIFNALSDLPGEVNDPEELIQVFYISNIFLFFLLVLCLAGHFCTNRQNIELKVRHFQKVFLVVAGIAVLEQ